MQLVDLCILVEILSVALVVSELDNLAMNKIIEHIQSDWRFLEWDNYQSCLNLILLGENYRDLNENSIISGDIMKLQSLSVFVYSSSTITSNITNSKLKCTHNLVLLPEIHNNEEIIEIERKNGFNFSWLFLMPLSGNCSAINNYDTYKPLHLYCVEYERLSNNTLILSRVYSQFKRTYFQLKNNVTKERASSFLISNAELIYDNLKSTTVQSPINISMFQCYPNVIYVDKDKNMYE